MRKEHFITFGTFTEAVNCLSKAIDIYTEMGRFTIAAKHHQTIAELYESDIADLERAMQHYEKSADYFRVRISNRLNFRFGPKYSQNAI